MRKNKRSYWEPSTSFFLVECNKNDAGLAAVAIIKGNSRDDKVNCVLTAADAASPGNVYGEAPLLNRV